MGIKLGFKKRNKGVLVPAGALIDIFNSKGKEGIQAGSKGGSG